MLLLQPGCSHDKELYYKTRDKYSALLRKTKTSYYCDLIGKCLGNSNKLFRVINSLSKQKSSESLPRYEDPLILANEFGTFFVRKIELINVEGSIPSGSKFLPVSPNGGKWNRLWCLNVIALGC
jgi:hypothetical protein